MMHLDKAIEILNCRQIPLKTAEDHDFFDALKMGIGALERIKIGREKGYEYFEVNLPGETKEGD